MKLTVSDPSKTEAVVKRAFYLAWVACGSAFGMGIFQDRGPSVSEDEVFNNAANRADYPGGNAFGDNKVESGNGKVYGDYVFGRMMKTGLEWNGDIISVSDGTPRPDYQAWCRKYKTYDAVVREAATQLGVTLS